MRKKHLRLAEVPQIQSIIKNPFSCKGKWNKEIFHNENSITLELGCGKGDFIVELAKRFPQRNFIGLDIRSARLWYGGKNIGRMNLENLFFIHERIERLTEIFSKGEISEIWLNFPDPYPKRRQEKKRMTGPKFLEMYKTILKLGGKIFLKTDNQDLFNYSVKSVKSPPRQSRGVVNILEKTDDLYYSPFLNEINSIQTTYEKIFLSQGKKIFYLSFSFK